MKHKNKMKSLCKLQAEISFQSRDQCDAMRSSGLICGIKSQLVTKISQYFYHQQIYVKKTNKDIIVGHGSLHFA